jgi:O-antigen ligase
MDAGQQISNQSTYEKFFAGALCALPVIAIVMPRALNLLPILVALIALALYRVYRGRWPEMHWPSFAWMAGLVALMGLTTFWAFDPAESLERTLKTAPILFGGALLFSLAWKENGNLFSAWFPFAFIMAGAVLLIELYAGAPFYHLVHERVPGDVNLFFLNRSASLLVILAPLAVTCTRASVCKPQVKHALYALYFILVAAALYRTDSQSAQLAVVIGAALYFLFPVRVRAAWIGLAACLALGIFATPWIAQYMFKIMPAYAENSEFATAGSGLARLEIWDAIGRKALERPLLGYGVEATRAMEFDLKMIYHNSPNAMHPHNFALQLWIELGIWGALFAAAFFAWVLNAARKMEPLYARSALAVFFTALSVAATGYGLWQGMWIGAFGMLFVFCVLAANKTLGQ